MKTELTETQIVNKIHIIRKEKVMLDQDLAELYDVETSYLKRQVRRNIDRFPEDFMLELTNEEFENLRSQNGTSSCKHVRIQKTLLSNFEHMEAFEVLAKAGDNPMVQKVLASEEDFIKFSNDLQFYDGFKNAVKANADASVGAWYMFKSADPSFVPCK